MLPAQNNSSLTLQWDESVGEGWRRIMLVLLQEGDVRLGEDLAKLPSAIHHVRKMCKRVRGLLRLIQTSLDPKIYRRENKLFRNASLHLAPLRDSEVLLDRLQEAEMLTSADFSTIRRALELRQNHWQTELVDNGGAVANTSLFLQMAARRFADIPLPKEVDPWVGIVATHDKMSVALERAYHAKPTSPHLFHEGRKQVKYLLHQVELLTPISPIFLQGLQAELHLVSDLLGKAHDWAELAQRATELEASPREVALLQEVAATQQHQLEQGAHPYCQRLIADQGRALGARLAIYYHVWQTSGVDGRVVLDGDKEKDEKSEKGEKDEGVLPADYILTTKEVATKWGVSISQLRRWLAEGEIAAIKIGRVWAISTLATPPLFK